MRKLMFGLALVVGAGTFAAGAEAAPQARAPLAFQAGHVETVQYWRHHRRDDWRRREAMRRHEYWVHRYH